MSRVLMIDDDEALAEMVVTYLGSRGLPTEARHDVASGLRALAAGAFDALVLDVMLPDGDGFDVLRRVRADRPTLPIVMLTARGDELDRIVGLELGADDYLPKPFNPRELLARLHAVLRRSTAGPPPPSDSLRFGALQIDRGARGVRVDGEARELTGRQFDLLVVLAERAGRVLSRDQILEALEEGPLEAFDRSIDVHVSRIRAVLEPDPRRPRWIKTVRGVGYVFADGER